MTISIGSIEDAEQDYAKRLAEAEARQEKLYERMDVSNDTLAILTQLDRIEALLRREPVVNITINTSGLPDDASVAAVVQVATDAVQKALRSAR